MKTRKKRKFKKRYWLLIDLAIVVGILVLLLYKPSRYNPQQTASGNQVSSYLTHELSPQLYNGLQREEPFELVILQEGINEAIAHSKWPKESEGIRFSTPVVFFVPNNIVLMSSANVKGMEFVVTIMAEPSLDQKGLLNLWVTKVKVGAMNITLLAKMIARRMYRQRLATADIDSEDLGVQIAASLLNAEPFEPIFEIDDKKVRVEKIAVTEGKLTIRLAPASP